MTADPTPDVLDNAVWSALRGEHRDLAETQGSAARYRVDVAPFAGLADPRDRACWADLATLVGPGGTAVVTGPGITAPADWRLAHEIPAIQMVDQRVEPRDAERGLDADLVSLGEEDVEDMLALVAMSRPGPFLPRTIELGGYLGVRRDGVLIAMAGQRMHPTGWAEISAVCSHPDYRGEGLGRRVTAAVRRQIRGAGCRSLLHVAKDNLGAIALYRSMGFADRADVSFLVLQAPKNPR